MPRAAPRPCSKHPHILIERGQRCPLCPKVAHNWKPDSRRGNRHARGYGSAWDKKRKEILERDNYLCQVCRQRRATQVDHRKQKASGGTDDDSNLLSICADCHKQKTASESHQGRGRVNPRRFRL